MSWIQKLYETYENCQSEIGKINNEGESPLLPICHTIQNAHIQITINKDGNFLRAKVITKTEAQTIIPCTEESAGRSGKKPECHPLCDSLQYVAGDFIVYGGNVTSGYLKNPEEPYLTFCKKLEDWCNSIYKHQKALSVLKYVKNKSIIKDLMEAKVLFTDRKKIIVGTKDELRKHFGSDDLIPEIFLVIQPDQKTKIIDQGGAFIRWSVESSGELQTNTWEDSSLWDSWINYYGTLESVAGLCYVSGKEKRLATQHPKRIRRGNDNAKIISSNDTTGFTFRGRFIDAFQVYGVGADITQKAHSALRWLISRQGFKRGDQAIVAWSTSGVEIPKPTDDAFSYIWGNEIQENKEKRAYTAQELGIRLKNRIAGYGKEIGDTKNVIVMALDSATPGRMAITYYRELTGSDFLHRIDNWHEKCSWLHNYRYIESAADNKKQKFFLPFVGAPTPTDIAEAAYGSKVDDKLRKSTIERLLPCIIDGQQIPRDIVESAIRKASNRIGLNNWEWNKALSIACALFKKYYEKENYDMALDTNRKTRDYLYGRLLAIADKLEESALRKSNEDRPTTATRLMQRFADHPYTTWKTIEHSLVPYRIRLGGRLSSWWQNKIDEVKDLFISPDDFSNDKPLSGEYLLAYSCQRNTVYQSDDENKN